MKISEAKLRRIIREAILLTEEQTEDVDFNPEELKGIPLKAIHKKMLDPNVKPAQYAKLDGMLDDKGNPQDQAIALAAFALSYADYDEGGTQTILKKALAIVPKIVKAREKQKDKK